ncbi:MAG: hypothetical protein MZV64_03210, partial [Ignavibacteriales bacterium]|nr:hypothetical protein [Ignavibacteriales bacterium]
MHSQSEQFGILLALFFKPWAVSLGKTEEELKKELLHYRMLSLSLHGLLQFMFWQNFFGFFGVDNIGTGLRVTFLCWLGFGAAQVLESCVPVTRLTLAIRN